MRSVNDTYVLDASQSLGKVPVSVNDLGVDLLTIAGHKIYAPKGTILQKKLCYAQSMTNELQELEPCTSSLVWRSLR